MDKEARNHHRGVKMMELEQDWRNGKESKKTDHLEVGSAAAEAFGNHASHRN